MYDLKFGIEIWGFKVNFLCQKSTKSFKKFRRTTFLMTLFLYCHFLSTLLPKIGPKCQTLISNRALIYQRPFKIRKCYLSFKQPMV